MSRTEFPQVLPGLLLQTKAFPILDDPWRTPWERDVVKAVSSNEEANKGRKKRALALLRGENPASSSGNNIRLKSEAFSFSPWLKGVLDRGWRYPHSSRLPSGPSVWSRTDNASFPSYTLRKGKSIPLNKRVLSHNVFCSTNDHDLFIILNQYTEVTLYNKKTNRNGLSSYSLPVVLQESIKNKSENSLVYSIINN
jgi:hypothetical protein